MSALLSRSAQGDYRRFAISGCVCGGEPTKIGESPLVSDGGDRGDRWVGLLQRQMRAAKPNLTHILHRRNAQITPEALLETADADVAASRKRGHCQRRMWVGLDDVDRGADRAGSNQFGLCRDDVTVWVM